MAPHKPRKSAPVEYSTDEEDMTLYDIEEEVESTKSIIRRLSEEYSQNEGMEIAVPGLCQNTDSLPPLLDSVVGGGTSGCEDHLSLFMDPTISCPGKGLALPNIKHTLASKS
ncbi:hypothetical protein TNCV_2426831 [Trichonephila clavipes]|nr:hypothetical protein TNCV_2426831 [Trichonephila clavipes]